MKSIDCRGQQCPQPVIQTRKLMLAEPGSVLEVLVDDRACRDNVARLAATMGYSVVVEEADAVTRLELSPSGQPERSRTEAAACGPRVIFIGSDQMGDGDPELGRILMKNFIFTLLEADALPDALYCVNSGVRLTVAGSDVLEPLQELANRGVDIASCGLCLEFFDIKATLAVGRVSNMLELVNALGGAGNIVRL
jgi:selenium metabolism protein YedF